MRSGGPAGGETGNRRVPAEAEDMEDIAGGWESERAGSAGDAVGGELTGAGAGSWSGSALDEPVLDSAVVDELLATAGSEQGKRGSFPGTFSLATLELDGFAAMREVQGEHSALEILDATEAMLSSVLRSTDVIARREDGGFVVLLRNTPAAGAVRAMEKAVRAIQGEQIHLESGRVETLTASVGVAGNDGESESAPEELLALTETFVERARIAGGGRIHWEGGEVMPGEATVVLLEDDIVTAGLIRHRLKRKGHRVVHLERGVGALAEIVEAKPSLIILDLNMAGIGGIGAISKIRLMPSLRKVPILVLSKVESEADVIRSFQLGADDYIQKPFSTPELVARVQRLLRGR
jgi:diguanylate cyclase (GGDEF)-like protein